MDKNKVAVRWFDGYMEEFQAEEVRFGSDLLFMRLSSGANRQIPLRQVRWFGMSKESHQHWVSEDKDAEIVRLTAERDAALNDLEKCAADASELCEYCIHDGSCPIPDDEMDSAWPDCYEWRGASRNSEAAEQALKGFVTDENNN